MIKDESEGRAFKKKQESRQRIVAAAAHLFIERGAKSVSMDEVATEAGVARRTLFNYFASKDDLLWEVVSPMLEQAAALAEARLSPPAAPSGAGTRGLDEVIGLCLELWRVWGPRLALLYSVDLADEGRLAELHGLFLSRFQPLVAEAISAEPGLHAERRLVGRVLYRTFVPLLLALDGVSPVGVAFPGASGEGRPSPVQDLEGRFATALRGLIAGVVRS